MMRGLGFDELFTAIHFVTADSAWQAATTAINFNNHVGYSLLARLSVELFGRSEWALRLPALLFGLATLPVLWWCSRVVAGPGIALAAALALALAPEHLRWSISARGYTALVLGVLGSSALLFMLLQRPTVRRTTAFALVTAATAYFHLHAIPAALVQGMFLLAWLVAERHDAVGRRGAIYGLAALAAAAVLTVLLYLPMLPALLQEVNNAGRSSLMPQFPWYASVELLSLPDGWGLLVVHALILGGLGSLALAGRRPGRRPAGEFRALTPWLAAYALALMLVPLLATTLARPKDLYPRFFIYALPFALVAASLGVMTVVRLMRAWLPGPARPLAWVPVVALAALAGASWYSLYPAAMTDEGFRAAMLALRADHPIDHPPARDTPPLCAFGAGAELFRWYSPEPLEIPKTVNELRNAYRGRGRPACVYRPAPWESRGSSEIRAYLEERSTITRHGEIQVYRSRE
jgi:mannosyltransferase